MILAILQFAVGSILVAWLPGHAWRRRLLANWRGIEAFLADVLLSVALITICAYLLHRFTGAPLTMATAVWTSLALVCAAGASTVASALTRLELKLPE